MVARSQLSEEDGFRVYDAATPSHVGAAEWNQLMIDVDTDLQAASGLW
jgi:hypothetical protein